MTFTPFRVHHNRVSHTVWLSAPDGGTRQLGSAATRHGLGALLARHRLIRTGDWIKEYGPVRSATVWTEVPA